jgi:hypothetical protein
MMTASETLLVIEHEHARRAYAEFQCTGDANAKNDLAEMTVLRLARDEAEADLTVHVWLCGEVETGQGTYTIGLDGRLRYLPFRSHHPLTPEGAWN